MAGSDRAPMGLYLALVHFPVYNKKRETIASAITTLNIHDISRVARTYGAKAFFVVTPLEDQKDLVEKIKRHWTQGFGALYNADRKEALKLVRLVDSIRRVTQEIEGTERKEPILIATDASKGIGKGISFEKARELLRGDKPICICFGTAWGLHSSVLEESDYVLEPICGPTEYNHLSVRSAASIIVDRLVAG